jgi:hypothetical protein
LMTESNLRKLFVRRLRTVHRIAWLSFRPDLPPLDDPGTRGSGDASRCP